MSLVASRYWVPTALDVLSKAAFFVFSPALLFIVLGDADIQVLVLSSPAGLRIGSH
jgi:hypothetical protein